MWKYDPSGNAGLGSLTLAADIYEGSGASYPSNLTTLNGKLYFAANDGIHGDELWEFDPTANDGAGSARLVEDLQLEGSSFPHDLVVTGGKLYFTTDGASGGEIVWEFDPTAEEGEGAISVVVDLTDSYDVLWIEYLTVMDDRLYFVAIDWDEAASSHELWQFNPGANNGEGESVLVAEFGERYTEYLTPFDGRLYFSLYDHNSLEEIDPLWVYDPSAIDGDGALNSYSTSDFDYLDDLVAFNHELYFVGYNDEFGTDVIGRFDPTANEGAGEFHLEIDINDYLDGPLIDYLYGMTVVGDSLFFVSSWYEEYYDEVLDEYYYEYSYVLWHYHPGDHQQAASLTSILESEGYLSIVATYQQGVYIAEFNWETDEGFLWSYQLTNEIEPVEVDGDFITDFQFVASPETVGTVNNDGQDPNAIFHEWEDVTGELWLTIDSEVPSGPFDFEFQFSSTASHFADPQLVSHLGGGSSSWQTTADGEALVTTGRLNGLNLSGYEVGARVLIATILYPQDLENLVGISSDLSGANAHAISAPGVELLSATINGELDVTVSPEMGGRFVPVIYDTDDSGRVGLSDFVQFISHYGQIPGEDFPDAYRFDFDRGGRVGLSDFVQFISNYGASKQSSGNVNMPFIADLLEGESDPTFPLSQSLATATFNVADEDLSNGTQATSLSTTPPPTPDFDPRLIDSIWREEISEEPDGEEEDEWLTALIK
ncbi:MAG: hypothetical protein WD045_07320 [Pirellulaceae bacterium]